MRCFSQFLALCMVLGTASSDYALTPIEALLSEYRDQGAGPFRAEAGKRLWTQRFVTEGAGQSRSCATCHTANPRKPGRHARTGKTIDALAPSVNPGRFEDIRKVRKWLRRNCKWTLGRTCTPREKGNVLTFLRHL